LKHAELAKLNVTPNKIVAKMPLMSIPSEPQEAACAPSGLYTLASRCRRIVAIPQRLTSKISRSPLPTEQK
jgi:hypothetical protein